jgi:hypothetical protein
MIERQVSMNSERSALITTHLLTCRTAVQAIRSSQRNLTRKQENEIKALQSLSFIGHKLWEEAVKHSHDYIKSASTFHNAESGIYAISRKFLAEPQVSPPRFIGPNLRCDCPISISFPGQCSHDIAYRNGAFVKEAWSERYHQLELLETSTTTCRQVANPLATKGGENQLYDVDGSDSGIEGRSGDHVSGDERSASCEEHELSVQPGSRTLTHSFVTETMKNIGNNIFKHPKSEMLLGMVIKVNELAMKGDVTTKTL